MTLEDLLRVKDNISEYGDDEYGEYQAIKSTSYDKLKFKTQDFVSV